VQIPCTFEPCTVLDTNSYPNGSLARKPGPFGRKESSRTPINNNFLTFRNEKNVDSHAEQFAVTETTNDDLSLVHATNNGNIAAFEELVRRYDRRLLRIASNITRNHEDAEDVVQETFLKAYRHLSQFQGNAKFSTWLTRIAVNESLGRLRKQSGTKPISLDGENRFDGEILPIEVADWAPNPEERYCASELREILTRSLQGLRPALRVVFVLRDVEGFSTSETAEALNLTQVAVKARLFRARLELREILNTYFKMPERRTAHVRSAPTQRTRTKPLAAAAKAELARPAPNSMSAVPGSVSSRNKDTAVD
jgi:RNA polymerase sigma-70 factor, ECF subfamily